MRKVKVVIIVFVSFLLVFMLTSLCYCYVTCFSEHNYLSANKTVSYNEVFFEPESKKQEIYDIGGFGYIDLAILTEHPEEIEYYNKYGIKVFEATTIDRLMSLLRQCSFAPVEREEAFWLNLRFNKSNCVTSLTLSSFWFNDEYNSLFSKTLVDEINEQCFGIIECSVFEIDDKLYLLAAYANQILGGSNLKYEKPNFAKTMTVVYEIKEPSVIKELINYKETFNPGEDRIYTISTINYNLLVVEVLVLAIVFIITRLKGVIKKKSIIEK